jgi:selenocysteine lyase/cysteine desulfurase
MASLESYFKKFRNDIIGFNLEHPFESGSKKVIYADWAASGRLYKPIEEYLSNELGPYFANTHTETTLTGTVMTKAYHQAYLIIKKHVNASQDHQLLFGGFGMTSVLNKFLRILGLRVPEIYMEKVKPTGNNRPLVALTHMEHHSNQTSWVEALCDVKIINRAENGLPDLNHLEEILKENKNRKLKIGSFTACSNVTGIETPIYEMAEIVHKYDGYCFVDYSASAPYVKIDMNPEKEEQRLDAIFFSPHKFLGGPGSSGVIIFDKKLYHNKIPDNPGGGTVLWTNPWGGHHYFDEIEIREDGGTPGIIQGIKASLAILLKDEMGIDNIGNREHQLKDRMWNHINTIPSISILDPEHKDRIGFISLYSNKIHHNLIVRLLNDKFGIQTRGGCSCAGTYGHILLNINFDESKRITDMINLNDLSQKPGWVRISVHPTMTDHEIDYIGHALNEVIENAEKWQSEYEFDVHTGDYKAIKDNGFEINLTDLFNSK